MKNSNEIVGIGREQKKELGDMLNQLLADYHLYYQNLRGLHWNIKGSAFFVLHAKFEEYYNDAQEKIDEIAERILTLEENLLHTLTDYLQHASIKEEKNVAEARQSVEVVIKNLFTLLEKQREILNHAQEANDEATASLMGDYIGEIEKTLWMLKTYLKA